MVRLLSPMRLVQVARDIVMYCLVGYDANFGSRKYGRQRALEVILYKEK